MLPCTGARESDPGAVRKRRIITVVPDGIAARRYLKAIEDGYGNVNPYHSRLHAADVLQSLHVTLHNGGMVGPESYADDLTLMTCYLAAVSLQHQILV